MKKFNDFVLTTYSPVLVLLAWELFARNNIMDIRFFPAPSFIFVDIYKLFREGVLLPDILVSLFRISFGLLLGGLPALILGILMSRSKFIFNFLHPLVALTYPIPKIAIIPFIIILLGLGELSKITVIALGVFPLILLNTLHGVSNIERVYFDIANIYNYSAPDKWRYIILLGALPSILQGVKLAVGVALILVVASEFIGSSSGVGYRIWLSWETFQIIHMYSGLFILSSLGWVLNVFLCKFEAMIMPWRLVRDIHEVN